MGDYPQEVTHRRLPHGRFPIGDYPEVIPQ